MQEPDISVIEVGAPDTPAVVVFSRDPASGMVTANVRGNMPAGELIDCLEFVIANIRQSGLTPTHIGTGLDWDGTSRVARYSLCGETLQPGDRWTADPAGSSCARCNRALVGD